MRKLIVLRGIPGCGKSTFIKKNNLKKYTLSADDLRLYYSAPTLNIEGKFEISQANNNKVWGLLFEMLEVRMQRGSFTVIDATNVDINTLNKYKDISKKYKYKLYCIDFSDVSLEQAKSQNLNREEYKQVPEYVLENMYQKMQNNKIPSGFIVLKPDQFEEVYTTPLDLSNYKKIHHIGDIHGCYTTLNEYLNNNGGIKDDEFYIFLGDYVDRGVENADTLKYMMSIYNKSNVLCLEGNHEIHLWNYANDNKARSYEFEQNTKPQLDSANISKKDIRRFYRKLSQCAYYEYNNNLYLCTHGGLSILPEKIDYVDTYQMIYGVGSYNDYEYVDDNFANNSTNNAYQLHGHRNTNNSPVKMNNNVFNLEGQIEFGGNLRCVQVSKNRIQEIETENNIFKFTKS